MSENESTLLHLGVGYRHSNLKEGGSIRTEPEFNRAPVYIDTDFLSGDQIDDAEWYQVEASLRSGPFWLHSEYINTRMDSSILGDPILNGYNVTLSWIATGEVREYRKRNGTFGPVPISRAVSQNGWGAWEYALRYSHLDASDELVQGGEMDIWSVGVNWWLTRLLGVNLNYRYITLDRRGLRGHSSGINWRIVMVLE
jgi:phosphate-selective porin OprO/OprP